MCFFKSQVWENNLEHSLQVKDLSPLWIILCFFKSPASKNVLGHWSQSKIFLITRYWKMARENFLKQWSQWKGFSQIWVLLWISKLKVRENDLEHWSQENVSSSIWVFLWFFKFPGFISTMGLFGLFQMTSLRKQV